MEQRNIVQLCTKIKGTILAIGHWPEMDKIQDESRKLIPTSETGKYLARQIFTLYIFLQTVSVHLFQVII